MTEDKSKYYQLPLCEVIRQDVIKDPVFISNYLYYRYSLIDMTNILVIYYLLQSSSYTYLISNKVCITKDLVKICGKILSPEIPYIIVSHYNKLIPKVVDKIPVCYKKTLDIDIDLHKININTFGRFMKECFKYDELQTYQRMISKGWSEGMMYFLASIAYQPDTEYITNDELIGYEFNFDMLKAFDRYMLSKGISIAIHIKIFINILNFRNSPLTFQDMRNISYTISKAQEM